MVEGEVEIWWVSAFEHRSDPAQSLACLAGEGPMQFCRAALAGWQGCALRAQPMQGTRVGVPELLIPG